MFFQGFFRGQPLGDNHDTTEVKWRTLAWIIPGAQRCSRKSSSGVGDFFFCAAEDAMIRNTHLLFFCCLDFKMKKELQHNVMFCWTFANILFLWFFFSTYCIWTVLSSQVLLKLKKMTYLDKTLPLVKARFINVPGDKLCYFGRLLTDELVSVPFLRRCRWNLRSYNQTRLCQLPNSLTSIRLW